MAKILEILLKITPSVDPDPSGGPFAALKNSLGGLGNLIPGITGGLGGLGSAAAALAGPLAIAAAAAIGVTKAFNAVLDIGEEFHKAFSTIRVGTGATGEALHELEGQFKKTFASTSDGTIESLSKTFADLNTQTGLTGKPLEQLTKQFGALEKFGDAPAVRSFTRHLGDFNVPADRASAVLDKLFVTSQKTGVPMGQLSDLLTKFGAPLRNFGFSIEEGTALLGKFEKEGVNTELVMGSLRIASGKFASAGVDLKTGLNDTIAAIKNAGSSSEATAIAMETFGRKASADMADAVRGGKFEIEAFTKSLADSKETILGARGDISSFGDVFEVLSRNAQVAFEPLGTLLVEGLTSGANAISAVVTPILDGIGSAVTGFFIPLIETMVDRVSRIGDAIGSIFSAFGSLGGQAEGLGSAWSAIGDIIGQIADVFVGLQEIITEALVGPIELAADIIGQVVDFIDSISTSAGGASSAWLGFNGALNAAKVSLAIITGAISDIKDAFSSVKEGISDGFGKLLSGDIFGAIKSVTGGVTDAFEGMGDSIGASVNEQLQKINIDEGKKAIEKQLEIKSGLDISASVQKLREQLALATSDAEKADITKQIAEKAPKAVEGVKHVTDEFGNTLQIIELSNDKLDEMAKKTAKAAEKDPSDRQQAILSGLQSQLALLDEQKKKLLDLQDASAKADAVDPSSGAAKKAKEAVEAQKKVIEEGSEDLKKSLTDIDTSGALKNLPADLGVRFDGIKQKYSGTLKDMAAETRASNLGDIIAESAKLKGDFDQNGALSGLVEKFNNAKSEIEKNSIAAEIEKQVPGAVAAYDDLGNATDINVGKINAVRDANGKAFGAQQQDLIAKYKTELQGTAQDLVDNKAKLERLGDAKIKAHDPATVKLLNKAFQETKAKVEDNVKSLQKSVTEGKKFGLIQGDVRQVGKEFGFSSEQAKATAQSVGEITEQSRDTAASIEEVAKQFADLASDAKKAVDADISAIALVKAKERLQQQITQDEKDAAEAASKRIGGDIKTLRIVSEERKKLDDFYDVNQSKKKQKRDKVTAQENHDELNRTKFLLDAKLAAIDEESLRRAEAARQIVVLELAAQKDEDKKLKGQLTAAIANKDATEQAKLNAELRRLHAAIDAEDTFQGRLKKKTIESNEALKKLREDLAASLFAIDLESAQKRIELDRATADTISGDDVKSITLRTDLLRLAAEEEAKVKIDTIFAGNVQFKAALQRVSDEESQALQIAQLRFLESVQSLNEKQKELDDKRKELAGKGTSAADIEAQTAGLASAVANAEKVVSTAQTAVESAQTSLRAKGEAFQDAFRKALTLPSGVIDPEKLTEEQRKVFDSLTDEQRKWLSQLTAITEEQRGVLLAAIQRQGLDSQRALVKITEDGERAISDAMLRARLATITDVAERERIQKLIEARKTLDAELKALDEAQIALDVRRAKLAQQRVDDGESGPVGPTLDEVALNGEQDRITKARAEARLKLRLLEKKTELDALRDENVGVAAALAFRENLWKGFYDGLDKSRRADLEKQKDALSKAGEDLITQLGNDKINLEQFFTDRAKNRADQAKVEEQLSQGTLRSWNDVWIAVRDGSHQAFNALQDQYTAQAATAGDEYRKLSTLTDEELKATGKTNDDVTDALKKTWTATAVALGAAIGSSLTTAQDALVTFGNMSIDILAKTLDAQIPALIALIFGKAFAEDPIFGAIVAGIATASLYALVGVAKSALTPISRSEGGVVEGGKQLVWLNDDPLERPEFVMSWEPTAKYKPQFDLVNKGADPFTVFGRDDAYTNFFIDIEGKLQVGFEKLNAVESQVSAIKASMKHGDNYDKFIHTEMVLEAHRETTTAVYELKEVVKAEVGKLIDEVKKGNYERERHTKESRATNELIGKDGYGNTSIAYQLAQLTKAVEEQNRTTSRW